MISSTHQVAFKGGPQNFWRNYKNVEVEFKERHSVKLMKKMKYCTYVIVRRF